MKFYQRAFKYIGRQRSRSALLGGIFFISLFICLSGVIILRVTHERIDEIAANSRANVSVFANELFTNEITEDQVAHVEAMNQIHSSNRLNQFETTLNDYMDFGANLGLVFGVEFQLRGIDDFTADGPFASESKRLVTGNFNLADHEVIIDNNILKRQGWDIGHTLPLIDAGGNIIEVVIAGTSELTASGNRENAFTLYGTPDLINEFQGTALYSSVQFFVSNPAEIEDIKAEITQMFFSEGFSVMAFDQLYQRLSAPMEHIRGLVEIMLIITVISTGVVVSLLLSIWIRERRKETALLLALGETKISIIAQRILEIFIIFVFVFGILILINHLFITNIGNFIFSMQDIPNFEGYQPSPPSFNLTLLDVIQTLGISTTLILITVFVALFPLIKSKPKEILVSSD